MPIIAEIVQKKCDEIGIRFHEPSQKFIAEIGYHEVSEVGPDGGVTLKRVRTTHYLGGLGDRNAHFGRYKSIKADWNGTVTVLRAQYDAAQTSRRVAGLPPLPRFKPVWPNRRVVRNGRKLVSERPTVPSSPPPLEISTMDDADLVQQSKLLKLTVRQAYTLYVEQQKKRVGLMAGKGINKNTFEKQVQCLTLGLGLNEPYNRHGRPIDVDMHNAQIVSEHQRGYGKHESFIDPLHFVAALERKPAWLDHVPALRDWQLPESFEKLRQAFKDQLGLRTGTRHYIRVLQLLMRQPTTPSSPRPWQLSRENSCK